MPTTKRQKIESIINKFIKYAKEQHFPFFDQDQLISKFRKDYPVDQVVGLIHKCMLKPYAEGRQTLKDNIGLEFERAKFMHAMNNNKPIEFELSDEQHDVVTDHVAEVIEIIIR